MSKITAQYQERDEALRIGMINKAVTNSPVNPCTDGSASCSSNAVCIPDQENDSYRVIFISFSDQKNYLKNYLFLFFS